MVRIESSTQIDQPRDRVFALLVDVDGIARWQKGVIQSKRLSAGPVRSGFEFEETVRLGPRRIRTVCTVTDMKEPERFAFEARSAFLDYEGSFELQPVGGGTRLSLRGTARLKGLWRLLQPLLAGDLRKEARSELAAMKRLLEA